MEIWNKRALHLMQQCKIVGKIPTDKAFCEKIGFDYTNITKVKAGKLGFQIENLISISKYTGASMDFICGLTNDFTLKKVPKTPREKQKI